MHIAGHVVLFGGTGFIGTHLAQHLVRENLAEKITLVDLLPPRNEPYCALLQQGLQSGKIDFVQWDLRKPIPASLLPPRADIVINLAAVHREPGHQPAEYFETNIYGAQNVCAYATAAKCMRMVFISSIAPYGTSEESRDETSLPVPETPYGSSKLVAETISTAWQVAAPGRKLLILRPGVVFGPGEKGNVTRLIRSIAKGYFVYLGNRNTRKAGGYVKELCFVAQFGLEHLESSGEGVALFNFSLDPPATMETFAETIRKVIGRPGSSLTVPRSALLGVAYVIDGIASTLHIKQPISPVRVRKTFRSTYFDPKRLRDLGYKWRYTIEDSFRDWRQDVPDDFLK